MCFVDSVNENSNIDEKTNTNPSRDSYINSTYNDALYRIDNISRLQGAMRKFMGGNGIATQRDATVQTYKINGVEYKVYIDESIRIGDTTNATVYFPGGSSGGASDAETLECLNTGFNDIYKKWLMNLYQVQSCYDEGDNYGK